MAAGLKLNHEPISVDAFYADLSHLSLSEREGVDFDQPDAIEWSALEKVVSDFLNGAPLRIPRYDYQSHTREAGWTLREARDCYLILEGLWTLSVPSIRDRLSLSLYVDCPSSVRLERRLARDVAVRGRSEQEVKRRWVETVEPAFKRFIEPQKQMADRIVKSSVSQKDLESIIGSVLALNED